MSKKVRKELSAVRIALVGSRAAGDDLMKLILQNIPANATEIVSGGADGIDKLAEDVAKELSIPTKIFHPEYSKFGKGAPLKRNLEILSYADEVLAFWDLKSKGTQQILLACIKENKPFKIIPIQNESTNEN